MSDPGSDPGEPEPQLPPHRLDPDRAAAAAAGRHVTAGDAPVPGGESAPGAIDTRRYRWTIGIVGLLLVIAASVYDFADHRGGTPGVAAGKRMHFFVAPLATGDVNKDANTSPRCDPAHPNPQGLNVCGRTPLVLAFFVTGSGACKRQIDTLQRVASQFSSRAVQFAALAVRADRPQTAALVSSHRWTIPVAYDRDGAVGALYGVEICPIVELSRRGGIVAQRLIGEHWLTVPALSARVRALLAG